MAPSPAVTSKEAPLTYRASSDSRNTTTEATSSGSTQGTPSGCRLRDAAAATPSGTRPGTKRGVAAAYWRALRSMVVFTPVGDTAFTAMPRPPSSSAAVFTSPITPHLDALYWGEMGAPMRPSIEAMATIRPRRRADMAGMAARMVLPVPVRFTSSTSRQPSSLTSAMPSGTMMPALATTPSSLPKAPTAWSTARASAGRLRTSPCTGRKRRPKPCTSRPVSARSAGVACA